MATPSTAEPCTYSTTEDKMAYFAIVRVENERVAKYAKFDTQAEADAHVATYGGFVAANPPGTIDTWRIVGQTVTDDPPPEPVPGYVTRYQFKKAVLDSGQLAALKGAYSSLTDEAKLYWDEADRVGRDSILITELKAALGLTDTQVDNFFRNAYKIAP